MEAAAASIPSSNVACYDLDLSSQESVRSCAEAIMKREPNLHILINNAGVMFPPYTKTPEGLELTMAVNHFNQFLFTLLLLDKMESSSGTCGRILNISSISHTHFRLTPDIVEDLNFEKWQWYPRYRAYSYSKSANLLATWELGRRLQVGQSILELLPFGIYFTCSNAVSFFIETKIRLSLKFSKKID